MAVETFNREEFQAALPTHNGSGEPLWEYGGLSQGEHVYYIPIPDTNKRIVIRSSVRADGKSAGTAQDSIRAWTEFYYPKAKKWLSLGKGDTGVYTTRVTGWQERLTKKLRQLWQLALDDSKKHRPSPSHSSPSSGADEPTKSKPNQKENRKSKRGGSSVPEGVEGSSVKPVKPGSQDSPTATTQEQPSTPFIKFGKRVVAIPIDDDEDEGESEPQPKREPNPEQRQAIEAPVDAAVRVLAGPGSGKTFVVARRYAFLLKHGAKSKDILAVTFSKTMADELLRRILKVNPDARETAAEEQVCTIHAICYRMLRADGDKRRVPKEWQVKRILQEIAEELWPYTAERPGWKEIVFWINNAKFRGLTTADDLDFFEECLGERHGCNLHEARRRFDQAMRQQNQLTFADMLFDVEQKLRRDSGFREKWQARFKWCIIDEGQDTSAQAMRILTTLAAPQDQLFIVGDSDQLAYRFAGSTPEANLFDGFEERYPSGILVKLSINYRSTIAIIETCQRLIVNNYADRGGPYEQRYLKDMQPRPNAPEGEPFTFAMYDGPEDEACALVDNLREQLANGRVPGAFFVGARTRAQLGYIEGPLTRAKIPFINIAGGSFWASKHVADIIAYLRLAYDESDGAAFKRVFNVASNWNAHPWGKSQGEYCHHRYLGKAFLEACNDRQTGKPAYKWVWQAVGKRRSFKPGVEDLTQFIETLKTELAVAESAAEVLQIIVDDCYRKYLLAEEGIVATDEAENGKLDDLQTVIEVAREFTDVGEFLVYVAEAVKAAEAAKDKSWDGYVILSTVHRLKGLEREVVYGIGISEGYNPKDDAPRGLLPHTFSMVMPPQNGILPTGGMGRIEDERCVMFVLCSRAKDEVHLSSVAAYRKAVMLRSRFISELKTESEART